MKCEKFLKENMKIDDTEIEEFTKNSRKKSNFGIIWKLTRRSAMQINKEIEIKRLCLNLYHFGRKCF